MSNNFINKLYKNLLSEYGPQGWWPLIDRSGIMVYEKNKLKAELSENQQLEICLGAILTQNTNWKNATAALQRLMTFNCLSLDSLLKLPQNKLAEMIKPAGYYNQKAAYIKNFLAFVSKYGLKELAKLLSEELRKKLLAIKGIGNETADCILLYGFGKCSFVVDAYTTRILTTLSKISGKTSYLQIQSFFESALDKDLMVYQEYHGLLVAHGKKYYHRKPYGIGDPFVEIFQSV